MSNDMKNDSTYRAVLILLDSMTQEQRAAVAMKLVKQGVTPPAPKPRKAPIKKRSKAAS